MTYQKNKRKKILDVSFDLLDKKTVLSYFREIINSNEKKIYNIATINLELIMLAQRNRKFKDFLNNKTYFNTIDGVGLLNVLSWYGVNGQERVCGSDIAYDLAEICEKYEKKYFILGASSDVSQQAKDNLKKLYPNLLIDNYSPPYTKSFSEELNNLILRKISNFKPDVLCFAFGSPKQELWIDENQDFLEKTGVKLAIGLGGTFDFISGKIKRAPEIYKKTGNEWVHRLLFEPNHMNRFKRQITTIPLYYYLCFVEYIKKKGIL